MARGIGAVVVGVLVVGVVVFALQSVGATLHPLPEGLDPMSPDDADTFAAHLAAMPLLAWALAFFSEVLGAFLGALAAGWIAGGRGRVVSGLIVGVALLGSVNNWRMFEHPTWFVVGQLVLYPVALMSVWGILARRQA